MYLTIFKTLLATLLKSVLKNVNDVFATHIVSLFNYLVTAVEIYTDKNKNNKEQILEFVKKNLDKLLTTLHGVLVGLCVLLIKNEKKLQSLLDILDMFFALLITSVEDDNEEDANNKFEQTYSDALAAYNEKSKNYTV
jgi:putative Ca2+/H+ antiporter (TMEM165/GDT1 family)